MAAAKGKPVSIREPEHLSSDACAKILKAMGDPKRLRILRHLIDGDKNVSELCEALKMDQPAVSHHLSLLRSAGLVREYRDGKKVYNGIHASAAKHLDSELKKIDLGCCSVELRRE